MQVYIVTDDTKKNGNISENYNRKRDRTESKYQLVKVVGGQDGKGFS